MENTNEVDQQLITAKLELTTQLEKNKLLVSQLAVANSEITGQRDENKKHSAEISRINLDMANQNHENEKRGAELEIATVELALQSKEKVIRTAELIRANTELAYQTREKGKRADELIIANIELTFQNEEKEKRSAELLLSHQEIAFKKAVRWYMDQGEQEQTEKFILANIDVASQSKEKDELINRLSFEEKEKKKQATELVMTYKELSFQIEEKGKRTAELILANAELAFQNDEKEKRAAELVIANIELALQNEAEGKRATALILANKDLIIQNEEKEKRALELMIANKELKQFAYIASHDLREPLRTISNYIEVFELEYLHLLDENGRQYIRSINIAAVRMNILVQALLDFSRIGRDKKLGLVDCNKTIKTIVADLHSLIKGSKVIVDVTSLPTVNGYEIEMEQLFKNLITNAIKFQRKDIQPKIEIRAERLPEKWLFSVSDNGIGIDSRYFERVFDLFQRLHSRENYPGNGVGLANCKKIVQLHKGEIWIESNLGKGSTFYFSIPN